MSTAWTSAKNGIKLPIYGIIPRKNPLPLDPTKVILKYKTGSTFDKEVIKDWIDSVISPYMVSQGYSKILLIIDKASCHKKLAESYDFIAKGIHVLYIPGRMAGLLQPAEVGWFATIKKAYKRKWNDWFKNEERIFTMQNDAKAPSYNECLKWLDDIWGNFNSDVLRRSFECCGIGNTPNSGTMEMKTDAMHSALRKLLMSKGQTIPNNYISTDIEEVEAEDQIIEYGEDLFENPEDGEFSAREMEIEHLNPVRIVAEESSIVTETSPIVIDENNNYARRSLFDISKYLFQCYSHFVS